MHYLNSLKQLVCCERMSEVFSSATDTPSVSLSKFFCQTSSVVFSKSIHTFFVTRFLIDRCQIVADNCKK